jgi:hypothetical protein
MAAFPYPPEVEHSMRALYRSLRENGRRYAAEAAKLGHGGTDYVAALLGCDPTTIRQGEADLAALRARPLDDVAPDARVRRPGGGRKKLGWQTWGEAPLWSPARSSVQRAPRAFVKRTFPHPVQSTP